MSTLLSMLGPGITEKSRFQWVKTFGADNLLPATGKNQPIIIKNDLIVDAFYESKRLGRTSPMLGNIMIHTYFVWACRQEKIVGFLAEAIHDRAMKAIAYYWKRNWQPEKHKCPIYGLMNQFNLIRSSIFAEHLPARPGRTKKERPSMIGRRDLIDGQIFGYAYEGGAPAPGDPKPYFEHPVFDWDSFHVPTPLEILLKKERMGLLI